MRHISSVKQYQFASEVWTENTGWGVKKFPHPSNEESLPVQEVEGTMFAVAKLKYNPISPGLSV